MVINAYIKKIDRSQINNLNLHFKEPGEKRDKLHPKLAEGRK